MVTINDFRLDKKPNWCPGCGDFSVQAAIQRAVANLGIEPENLSIVSGIGCSGRISGYIRQYGFHSIHGRSLPIAQGLKLANNKLTVIATGGDGDGFAIGTNHTIHAMRRNIDITYIIMDNQIYGLTKGQVSPLSQYGTKSKSTPYGSVESPIKVLELALAAGATYIAQGFSGNIAQLTKLIEEGIKHKGFSFINVFSPCVTFNKSNTYEWFKENLVNLDDEIKYDPSNKLNVYQKLLENNELLIGLIYRNKEKKPLNDILLDGKDPLIDQNLILSREDFNNILEEFK